MARKRVPLPLLQLPRRLLLVWLLLLAAGLGMGARLYHLQVVRAPALRQKAQAQQTTDFNTYVPRRPIVDRRGNTLALDRATYTLYAHPRYFQRPRAAVARELAAVLDGQSERALRQRLRSQPSGIRLAEGLSPATAEAIRQRSLAGVELSKQYARFYPQRQLAAEVLGYVGFKAAGRGQAGVELAYQSRLQRSPSDVQVAQTRGGQLLPRSLPPGALDSDRRKLQLTLDLRLQRAVDAALKKQMQAFRARRGTVIVIDASSGAIRALATRPSYNPNRYYRYEVGRFRNWAVSTRLEPGSTLKPINVAIALDANAIQPDATVRDPGKIQIGRWEITNYDYDSDGGHGRLSATEVLERSSNVGMVKLMQQMAPGQYYRALRELGIERPVGADLPGDRGGNLKPRLAFTSRPIAAATAAFGHGLSLSSLKLAQLHAALANGGKLVTPHVARGLVGPNGQLERFSHPAGRRVFKRQTAETVVDMMASVVENGSGQNARIPGYRIAGKTGTSKQPLLGGGYNETDIATSFVGILPARETQYVVLAVVDDPQKRPAYGSTVAAPVVKSVMEALIANAGIAPGESQLAGDRAPAGTAALP
ncbi:MAG: cell division protein FtsI [Cyanobacteria bacterium QS_8_64_29]|nr:MAG: cell division protein FtsI [Cyanobacteria bacterium QS_8_64_29]